MVFTDARLGVRVYTGGTRTAAHDPLEARPAAWGTFGNETPRKEAVVEPTGPIRTLAPWGPFGFDWENLTRWSGLVRGAAEEFGAPDGHPDLAPAFLARVMTAMMAIESGGVMFRADGSVVVRDDGFGDGLSVGLLQVKPDIWQPLVPDADAFTPEGNVRLGTAIMAQAIRGHGSWEAALTRVYFPSDDPNGTTQNEYVVCVRGLLNEQGAFAPPPGPEFVPFAAPRRFRVRLDARATGRRGPSRAATWIRDFGPGEAITCDGFFRGEVIAGEGRWLRTSAVPHLAVHLGALTEPI